MDLEEVKDGFGAIFEPAGAVGGTTSWFVCWFVSLLVGWSSLLVTNLQPTFLFVCLFVGGLVIFVGWLLVGKSSGWLVIVC